MAQVAGQQCQIMMQSSRRDLEVRVTNQETTLPEIASAYRESPHHRAIEREDIGNAQEFPKSFLLALWVTPIVNTFIDLPVRDEADRNAGSHGGARSAVLRPGVR